VVKATRQVTEAAERLFEEADEVPWSFGVAVISAAGAAYELARRDLTWPAADQGAAPDQGDLTAV
jgi:hypothetical protein